MNNVNNMFGHLLRKKRIDKNDIQFRDTSKSSNAEKRVSYKSSGSQKKFTIINYGKNSIPNSLDGEGDDKRASNGDKISVSNISRGSLFDVNNNKMKINPSEKNIDHADDGRENEADDVDENHDHINAAFLLKPEIKVDKSGVITLNKIEPENFSNNKRDNNKNETLAITIYPSSNENSLERPRSLYTKNQDSLSKLNINPKYQQRLPSYWSKRNSLPVSGDPYIISDSIYDQLHKKRRISNYLSNWDDPNLAKFGRNVGRSKKLRLIQQSGECNVQYSNVDKRSLRFLTDIFTTLLELQWRYNILIYLTTFVSSWIIFAFLWWGIHLSYGLDENGVGCVDKVDSFKTALLFSIETQQTIGYGSRSITDRCFMGFVLLMVQSVFGAVTQCLVTGIIFSRLARPSRRAETVIFSKKAVICKNESYGKEDNSLNLEFRLGDMRNSQLIGININAVVVRKKFLENGKQVTLCQKRLQLCTESDDDFYYLAWPIKVIHKIDESSPFWGATPNQIKYSEFEILVVLEANCESTGGTVQVKTSYLPSEIEYGSKLAPLFTRTKIDGRYKVDYSRFHETVVDENMPKDDSDISRRNFIMANNLMSDGSLPSFEDEKL